MKMLNKKGFIMVETLIVTAFVVALFVLVYKTTVPFMGEYEQMTSYDDIDSVYAANLWKQMINRYGNTKNIDSYLESNSYIIMNDCNNKDLYIDSNYCLALKKNLGVTDNDYAILTKYDITDFRDVVNSNDFFDSGNLSNFRDYIATVPDLETSENSNGVLSGKYRLFMTRTVNEADSSTTRKFVNIGVYAGGYENYIIGQEVTFNPGDGTRTFYVLKNSLSTDETVTLILANNLENSNMAFNSTGTAGIPNTVLSKLKTVTDEWTNVGVYKNKEYVSDDGYTISYDDDFYRARLLHEEDIREILGCKEDGDICFDHKDAFTVNFDTSELSFLVANLADGYGYWTGSTIPGSGIYAWSIQNGKIAPTLLTESSKIGVRPVITVLKEKLK